MGVPRAMTRLSAMLGALVLALASRPALAVQEAATTNDRAEVMIWTLVAVTITMLLLAIGYVYRRAVGDEKPPPVPILEPGQRITSD